MLSTIVNKILKKKIARLKNNCTFAADENKMLNYLETDGGLQPLKLEFFIFLILY